MGSETSSKSIKLTPANSPKNKILRSCKLFSSEMSESVSINFLVLEVW